MLANQSVFAEVYSQATHSTAVQLVLSLLPGLLVPEKSLVVALVWLAGSVAAETAGSVVAAAGTVVAEAGSVVAAAAAVVAAAVVVGPVAVADEAFPAAVTPEQSISAVDRTVNAAVATAAGFLLGFVAAAVVAAVALVHIVAAAAYLAVAAEG